MGKFLVRLIIIYCSIYFIYVIINAWNGNNVYDDAYKILIEFCIYLFARDNPKYNCRYMRFLALNMAITEAITYLDSRFLFFEDTISLLIVLTTTWVIAVSTTIVLAIRHFRRVKRLKR